VRLHGWECLIKACRQHYDQYPEDFFNWCAVEHTPDSIIFVKAYADCTEYNVLEIDINKPLEDQVREKLDEIENAKKYNEEKIREQELKTLKRLQEKYKTETT